MKTTEIPKFPKKFYGPGELTEAREHLKRLNAEGLEIAYNFDPESEDFPETHGLLIAPIMKREDSREVVVGALYAAVPTVESVKATEDGQKLADKVLTKALFAKVMNPARPNMSRAVPALPYTLSDFTKQTRQEIVGDMIDEIFRKTGTTDLSYTPPKSQTSTSFLRKLTKTPQFGFLKNKKEKEVGSLTSAKKAKDLLNQRIQPKQPQPHLRPISFF